MAASLTIEQPMVNRVTIFLVVAAASYGLFVVMSLIGGGIFIVLFLVGLGALWWFCYRTLRIEATANQYGIAVTNLWASADCPWATIDRLSVEENEKGGGSGIVIHRTEGDPVAIEASWGPWYQGKGRFAKKNAERCEALIDEISTVRPDIVGGEG